MELKNAKRWAKAGAEPYYVGLLGYLLAFSVRYTLHPLLYDHLPMLFFAMNCIVIAFLYGFWPSIFTLALSIPTASYFFVKPFNSLGSPLVEDVFMLIVYGTLVILTAIMLEWLRREQYKSNLIVMVADSRYRLLVEADQDRRTIMKEISG